MNGYTNYLNRIKYINNNVEIIWIFYKKFIYDKKKRKCRYLSFFEIISRLSTTFQIILCPLSLLHMIVWSIVYILVIMWIDIIIYLCVKKNNYKYFYAFINSLISIEEKEKIDNNENNIWNECEGTEEKKCG